MKVIIQIPCFNEEATLAATIAEIPPRIEGVDSVEVLVVDDGSTDKTVTVARSAGAGYLIRHCGNRGLAASFATGLNACLRLGADIIVNTDGDNQYAGADVPRLIAPIMCGEADVVVGDRQVSSTPYFSASKKWLQALGSWAVRTASGIEVPDAVSGFRAFSREAAMRINVASSFSYTIETLIQAGSQRMVVVSVPVRTNPPTRPSRLFTGIPQFVMRSLATLVRSFAMYRPLAVFLPLSAAFLLIGLLPVVRFLGLFFQGRGDGHIQSLVLGGILLLMGTLTLMMGLLADLTAFNRRLLELTLEKVRRIELNQRQSPAMPSERLVADEKRMMAGRQPYPQECTENPLPSSGALNPASRSICSIVETNGPIAAMPAHEGWDSRWEEQY